MMHRIVPELDETFAWMVPPILNPRDAARHGFRRGAGPPCRAGLRSHGAGDESRWFSPPEPVPAVTAVCYTVRSRMAAINSLAMTIMGGYTMDDLFEHMMESDHDRAINGFYKHFMIFAAVIAVLAIINIAMAGNSGCTGWCSAGASASACTHSSCSCASLSARRRCASFVMLAGPHAHSGAGTDGQTPGTQA